MISTIINEANANLIDEIYLRDLVLLKLELDCSKTRNVSLFFGSNNNEQRVILKFNNFSKFDFFIDDDIYYIEDYKLFYDQNSKSFYLSIDPDRDINEKTDTDCGVIISESMEYSLIGW